MGETIYGYTKVGLIHFKGFPLGIEPGQGPIVETPTQNAEDAFFTAVEVGWVRDFRIRNEARRLLDESHLAVYYATQPAMLSQKLNLNSMEPKEHIRAINQVKNCIEGAYDLEAQWLRLIAGKDPGDEKRPEATALLVDSSPAQLHFQICDYAGQDGNLGIALKIIQPRFGLEGGAIDTIDVAPYFRILWDKGFFEQEEMPVISAEVRPVLAGESFRIVIASSKRVTRKAWAQCRAIWTTRKRCSKQAHDIRGLRKTKGRKGYVLKIRERSEQLCKERRV